ncbi:5-hydroxyisourate hydrolase [Cupriavidus sp. YR651]|nr:5-hydroxyisourate hydrolase [Cupriavidus sp. YR651]
MTDRSSNTRGGAPGNAPNDTRIDTTRINTSRRRFALQSVTLGSGALIAATSLTAQAAETAPTSTPAPNQTTGPVQQGGLSPRLTMHALDTYHGTPAAGLRVDFLKIDGAHSQMIRTVTLPGNGRTDPPLLIGDTYRAGTYELVLHVDEYFAERQAALPQPPFLSRIPLRFRITDVTQRIHLPVLFGPWSYNYYRGS